MKRLVFFPIVFLLATMSFATPSTQIWNPSTDIQATGTTHFGIDNYFPLVGPAEGGYGYPTDLGLTYGLIPGGEIGIDLFEPQTSPFVLNAKYAIPENGGLPSFAIGGYGFGTLPGVTDQNVLYGLLAKTFPFGRISAGYFSGNRAVLLDPSGNPDNFGLILTWDKVINDKLWLCVDYADSNSVLGATFYGLSWVFSSNTSVIFGYGTWNNGAKPTVTTQLDVNF